ncbi:MAG: ompW2 [Solimicrobium sp.]|nr:ompW2 [Solimicrobium sp.]
MPQDSSTPIAITSPTPRTLPGSGATVNKANTLGFAVTSFLTDNWAATLDLGVPPKYKLNGTGTLESVGQVGTAKQWAPALLAKYYFGEANSQFRPSIGLGLSRVHYTNIELSKGFQEYIGAGVGNKNAVTTADLKASWAPVFNAGLSYAIDKDWSVNFSVSYLKMKTKADLTTKASATTTVLSNTTMTINPIVTYLNIGYRF